MKLSSLWRRTESFECFCGRVHVAPMPKLFTRTRPFIACSCGETHYYDSLNAWKMATGLATVIVLSMAAGTPGLPGVLGVVGLALLAALAVLANAVVQPEEEVE